MSTISENGNTNNNFSRIHQFYGEELLAISKHDPLHELTVQEKDLVRKIGIFLKNLETSDWFTQVTLG